ncbi:MAG: hypothetical protein KDN18_20060 [Verrucomicrobiae bacterium]|nr:hypothetical protein [Verrucomicrobiae bacterium]
MTTLDATDVFFGLTDGFLSFLRGRVSRGCGSVHGGIGEETDLGRGDGGACFGDLLLLSGDGGGDIFLSGIDEGSGGCDYCYENDFFHRWMLYCFLLIVVFNCRLGIHESSSSN